MIEEHYSLLKEVLAVRTQTRREEKMVEYLCNYFKNKGYTYEVDHMKNVYVTKGNSKTFPCVISHTDTVHDVHQSLKVVEKYGRRPETFGKTFNDVEDRLFLTGVNNQGKPSGIGGDDKCGVYVCLRLLEIFDNLKAAFFVSEETGCWGSQQAKPDFFKNVGWTIQFDAPGNHLITERCSSVQLFERDSDFFKIAYKTLSEFGEYDCQTHPYTDIKEIKRKFDHACINISCGYYNMHSPRELVDVEDVETTVNAGTALINNLGWNKYPYKFDYEAEMRRRKTEWQNHISEMQRKRIEFEEELHKYLNSNYETLPPIIKEYIDRINTSDVFETDNNDGYYPFY